MASVFESFLPRSRFLRLVLGLVLLALCGMLHYSYSSDGADSVSAAVISGLSSVDSPNARRAQDSRPAKFTHPDAIRGEQNRKGPAVIAMASGYGTGTHKNFAGTLRKSGYTGDIVIAVEHDIKSKESGRVFEYLENLDVVLYPVQVNCGGDIRVKSREQGCLWTGLDGKTKDPSGIERPIALIRYNVYLALAEMYYPDAWILLSDYRDVFFQDDPFKFVPASVPAGEKPLWVFEEDKRSQTMGTCPFNRGWVTSCWGKHAVDRFEKDPIRCSGNTMGTQEAIVIYNQVMIKEMEEKKCHAYGQDQGYHNYLILSGGFQMAGTTLTSWYRGTGPVNTVGLLDQLFNPRSSASLKELGHLVDGTILNNDNSTVSPCIHQWDRFQKEIHALVGKRGFTSEEAKEFGRKRAEGTV